MKVVDDAGEEVEDRFIVYTRDRRALKVDRSGLVAAREPGDFTVIVSAS